MLLVRGSLNSVFAQSCQQGFIGMSGLWSFKNFISGILQSGIVFAWYSKIFLWPFMIRKYVCKLVCVCWGVVDILCLLKMFCQLFKTDATYKCQFHRLQCGCPNRSLLLDRKTFFNLREQTAWITNCQYPSALASLSIHSFCFHPSFSSHNIFVFLIAQIR